MTDFPDSGQPARWARAATAAIGWIFLGLFSTLAILQAALKLPSGYDIDAFLAFTDAGAVAAASRAFLRDPLVGLYADAYLAVDLAFFIPAYLLVTLRVGAWLDRRLLASGAGPGRSHPLVVVATMAVAALVAIDIVETTGGLIKLGHGWMVLSAPVGVILGVAGLRTLAVNTTLARRLASGVAGGLALLVAATFFRHTLQCDAESLLVASGCLAHRAKGPLAALVVLPLLAGMLTWLLGGETPDERERRKALRAAVGEVVVRSRYVLVLVAMLTALLFLGGQSRDVLVGMLTDVTQGSGSTYQGLDWLAIAVSLVALWTLSHSCWLWARVACRVPGPVAGPPTEPPDAYVESFAKYWSRALGVAPLLIFSSLASKTLGDLVAVGSGDGAGKLLTAALTGLLLGGAFIAQRERVGRRQRAANGDPQGERYFDDPAVVVRGKVRLTGAPWRGPRYRFWFVLPGAPVWLPLVSFAAMLLCRLPGSVGNADWPTLAFPTMLFAFSGWLGVFGWLGLLERRHAFPWVLLVVGLAGVFGALGWTDNHVVWSLGQHQAAGEPARMWLVAAAMAAVLGGAAWWLVSRAQDARLLHRTAWLAGFGVATFAVLLVADRIAGAGDAPPARGEWPEVATPRGVALDDALAGWLTALQKGDLTGSGPPLPIYFVATEGGGARAAYWTAIALQGLAASLDQFTERTFALSGVSGGSIGAAAFVACRRAHPDDAAQAKGCVDRLGATDLVSPLLGSLLFEDVLARIVPTAWCRTPACGVFSRGVWFERVLQRGVPELKPGVREVRPSGGHSATAHRPYLFLNSTWVESGERAIASEVQIDATRFPSARDTIGIAGQDLTLATAAHNSARFPFVNAIGAVRSSAAVCAKGPAEQQSGPRIGCGHVADGGYFDNSGSHTVIDILRALHKLLDGSTRPGPRFTEWTATRQWALQRLAPQVIFIHNGVAVGCERKREFHQPTRDEVECTGAAQPFEPEAAARGFSIGWYPDLLGVAQTVVNVSGLGANRRRADALLIDEVQQLRSAIDRSRPAAARTAEPSAVRCVEHDDTGALYPLGWYLSQAARHAMARQVDRALHAPACRPGTKPVPP